MAQRIKTAGIDYDTKAVHLAVLEDETLYVFRYHSYAEQSSLELLEGIETTFGAVLSSVSLTVLEAPLYIQNPKTAFALSRVYLLVDLLCQRLKLAAVSLGSSRWKKLGLGYAKLDKGEVFQRMRERFGGVVSDSHFADCAGMCLAGRSLMEGKNGQ